MSALLQDVKYGLRRLAKQPGFTLVAVLTLALGIGANTAIFSAIHTVLLQQLPVREPERLVLFSDTPSEGTMHGDPGTGEMELFSYPVYDYFRNHLASFQGLAAIRSGESALSVVGEGGSSSKQAQMASGHLVAASYFDVLSARAKIGRTLNAEDDSPGAPPVGVVSDGYWRARLGSDPSAVGRVIVVNGTSVTIVGVMPAEFFGERIRRAPDYWLPIRLQPRIELTAPFFTDPEVNALNIVGRLKSGVTLTQAQASADVALRQYLTNQAGATISPARQADIAHTFVRLAPGNRGISTLRVRYEQSLYVLAAVVALVMLIACANLANLLLARAATRHSEIAVRLALGASSGRLAQQMLTEGILLALAGGAVGLLFADWGVHLLVRLVAPTEPLDVGVNPLALGFTAALSLGAGILFSLAPAWRSGRMAVGTALKERSPGAAGGRLRVGLTPALVAGQVAFSLILLVGAGLLTRSLMKLETQDLGFNRESLLLVRISPRLGGYKPAGLAPLYNALVDRVGTLSGVRSATVATYSPLSGNSRNGAVTIEGRAINPGEDMFSSINLVGPHFTEALGLSQVLGRPITVNDVAGTLLIAVVNQAFAQAYFPGQNPIGRRFGFDSDSASQYEIVGVVGSVRYDGIGEPPGKMVYLAMLQAQDESAYASELEIRTSGPAAALAARVRGAIAEVDAKLPIYQVTSIDVQVDNALRQPRLLARLVGVFGVLAVLLACVGLYGVIAQSVVRRTNELGIRMALGADAPDIIRMVLRETMVLIGAGLAIGLPIALIAAQLLRRQLFGVGAQDPLTLIAVTLLLVAVASVAGYIPAWRASRVDPMVALRGD